MLILARKEDDKIVIGDDIVITVTKISGSIVTLGIEAPKDVPVLRKELMTVNYKERNR